MRTPVAAAHAVPANASRFFDSPSEARRQPEAVVELAWDYEDPYLVNAAFDESLISHDGAYCTSVVDMSGKIQIPTLDYFEDALPGFGGEVVDIGCGQGELVEALRRRGVSAVGYDPVLRREAPHLKPRYWTAGDSPQAALFVMRCVLPHIPNPWRWVRDMGAAHPGSLLLVEYQRLQWMVDHDVWYQLSHDHVNTLRLVDFEARFEVLNSGRFGDGEWEWVLLKPDTYRAAEARSCDARAGLEALERARVRQIESLASETSVVLWGAAGKGIVLAHALLAAGARVRFAIDADKMRWGRFMEGSGVRVVSPDEGAAAIGGSVLVVCNPRHEPAVLTFLNRQGARA